MYVVPIFQKTINNFDDTTMKQVWMLLERNGTFCSSVESLEDAAMYAAENDIPLTGEPFLRGNTIFLPVDSASTLLDQFYTWNETRPDEQPMRTVWRPFVWITPTDSNEDIWGTNVHLKNVEVGNGLSVLQIITEYFGAATA